MQSDYQLEGLAGLFVFLVGIAFAISVSGNLRKLLLESRKQTSLLERIARNTQPPVQPGSAAGTTKSLDYMEEPKASGSKVVVLVLGAIALVLVILALARN